MSLEKNRSKLTLNRDNRTEGPAIEERLHKVLANAGLGSRRMLEERIEAGEVRANGETATLGSSVRVGDRVEIDGKAFMTVASEPEEVELLIYHKPEGEVTTHDDPEGRPTVFEKLPRLKGARWVSVGRLDINTTGLLLVTTDGELANALMHPSREVEREYVCRIHGTVEPDVLEQLKRGVELDDGPARFDEIAVINLGESHSWFRVLVREGRNREVRRIWEAVGLQVSRLKRIRYGSIELPRDLRRGHHRALDADQVLALRRELGLGDVPQALTLQPVIGVRRAAKSTEFRPDQRSVRAWSSGHGDEAREIRAFDNVRDDSPRSRKSGRKPKGGGRPMHGGGASHQFAPTAPGGVPPRQRRRFGATGPRPGEAWTPNTETLRTMTANERGPSGMRRGPGGPGQKRGPGGPRPARAAEPYGSERGPVGPGGNRAGPRGPGGGPGRGPDGPGRGPGAPGRGPGGPGRNAGGPGRGPGGPGRGPGGPGRGPGGAGRGAEGRGPGGPRGPGGDARKGGARGNAQPFGFPSDHAYAQQRHHDSYGNGNKPAGPANAAPGAPRRGRGRNRPKP
ncbi:MAG TPA: pseudouridine synthase [Candidatus Saccharimonadia bacterium]|nr:pseudouridine synthase [Candidatus Saccharimonadia bacterium]